jgi:hypothetical protein
MLKSAYINMRRLELMEMSKRNGLEQKALQQIMNTGFDGILQSDLWRKLGASSREGSRIALKLETKKLIRREKELRNGRWTYRLYPKRFPARIDSIADVPCLMCSDNPRCDPSSAVSPQSCDKLTEWLVSLSQGESGALGDS